MSGILNGTRGVVFPYASCNGDPLGLTHVLILFRNGSDE